MRGLKLELQARHRNRAMFNKPEGLHMETKRYQLIALELEQRSALPTAEAAAHLNRAMRDSGPIQPVRVNGRLAWLVADIKSILSGVSK